MVFIDLIDLVLFFIFRFLLFHDILYWELDLKEFLFFGHFSAHEAAVKCAVPLVLVFL
jgi:hypothetical protein